MSGTKRPRPSTSSSHTDTRRLVKRSRTPETGSPSRTFSFITRFKDFLFNPMSRKPYDSAVAGQSADLIGGHLEGSQSSSGSLRSGTASDLSQQSSLDSEGGSNEPASVRALLDVDSQQKVRRVNGNEVVDMTGDDKDEDEDEDDSSKTAGPSRTGYTSTKVYPNLPQPGVFNLFDEGSLRPSTSSQLYDDDSIDLGDVEDIDPGASSQSSRPTSPLTSTLLPELPTRRPKPQRPNLEALPPDRVYDWMRSRTFSPTRSSSSRSSTSSRKSSRKPSRKRSNMRSELNQLAVQERIRERSIWNRLLAVMPGEEDKAKSILNHLGGQKSPQSKTRQFERIFHRNAPKASSSKHYFAELLNARTPKTDDLDQVLANANKPITPAQSTKRLVQSNILSREYSITQESSVADITERVSRQKLDEEEEIQARLAPKIPKTLTPDQKAIVMQSLGDKTFRRSLVAEVNSNSLNRLRPSQWLDDEIVNFYSGLLQERSEGKIKDIMGEDQGVGRKVHAFNSFFYAKLSEQGYEKANLKRWTKKVDIFEKDVVLIPINLGNMHWTAAAINLKEKRLEYYDSMGDGGYTRQRIFDNLRKYLDAEHRTKKGSPFPELDQFEELFNEHAPQQDNGSDCGVFSMQTLESIARGRDYGTQQFEFKAGNMPYFRQLMIYEIAEKTLVKRW